VSLLVTGETGSGKEYFAKALHAASARRGKPLRRGELRGDSRGPDRKRAVRPPAGQLHRRRAKGKRGLIQAADGGTLFLDEIGDMPLSAAGPAAARAGRARVLPIGATRSRWRWTSA
jgi:transcriptional regulator of acetoin/glycerol metabolism